VLAPAAGAARVRGKYDALSWFGMPPRLAQNCAMKGKNHHSVFNLLRGGAATNETAPAASGRQLATGSQPWHGIRASTPRKI
jgi:hypothetical protein